jgi:hypothetical protein
MLCFQRPLCVIVFFLALSPRFALAGMPTMLPTHWTANSKQPGYSGEWATDAAPFLQAISFFVVVLLLAAWAVKGLWHVIRRDVAWLPALSYRRALGLVTLWGLLFIVVLTMISGARELMTPGAWRKQGWTYKLADSQASDVSSTDERRHALEQLRQALWHYAATHEGRFPPQEDAAIDAGLWKIPGFPGLRFLYVADRQADDAAGLLVFEPELDDENRLVLLTSGMIGQMRSAEIRAALPRVRRTRNEQ